jgi:hypothetical protein
MIMLAVLTALGVAAVRLASQERANAGMSSRVEFSQSCANAAVAQLWGEMSQFGLGYLGSGLKVDVRSLPDGTRLTSPGHYGQPTGAAAPEVKSVTYRVESATGTQAERDCTNKLCGPNDVGRVYNVTAHCIDSRSNPPREAEVEIALRFAI